MRLSPSLDCGIQEGCLRKKEKGNVCIKFHHQPTHCWQCQVKGDRQLLKTFANCALQWCNRHGYNGHKFFQIFNNSILVRVSIFPKRSVKLVLDIYLDIWNYPFHRKVANTEVTNLCSFWSLFALESSRAKLCAAQQ